MESRRRLRFARIRPDGATRTGGGSSGAADTDWLIALQLRQSAATSVGQLYDFAVRAAMRCVPCTGGAMLSVDAEGLEVMPGIPAHETVASRRLCHRLGTRRILLGEEHPDAVAAPDDPALPELLEVLLRAEYGIAQPLLGRVRLDHMTVAVLLLDAPEPPGTDVHRCAVQAIARATSTALAQYLGTLYTGFPASSPGPVVDGHRECRP